MEIDIALSEILYDLTDILGEHPDKRIQEEINRTLQSLQQKKLQVTVMGDFKQGKSSLMNALIGTPILPTDIHPLEAGVNRISYGCRASAYICYNDGQKKGIPVDDLSGYISNLHDSNQRAIFETVREVEIRYPIELCRNHIELVDISGITPLLGFPGVYGPNVLESVLNKTNSVLNETNVIIYVLSADIPFSQSDAEVIRELLRRPNIEHIIFVMTKMDLIKKPSDAEKCVSAMRKRISESIVGRLKELYGSQNDMSAKAERILQGGDFKLYSVAPDLAMEPFQNGDEDLLEKSKIPYFARELAVILDSLQQTKGLYSTAQLIDKVAGTLRAIPAASGPDSCREVQHRLCECRSRIETLEALAEKEGIMVFKRKTIQR